MGAEFGILRSAELTEVPFSVYEIEGSVLNLPFELVNAPDGTAIDSYD